MNAQIKAYDWERIDKFKRDHVHAVRSIHESFGRQLPSILSATLRQGVRVEVMADPYQEPIEAHINTLAGTNKPRAVWIVFSMKGTVGDNKISGSAAIQMPLNLFYLLIERQTGGKDIDEGELREKTAPSELDVRVFNRMVQSIMSEYSSAWSEFIEQPECRIEQVEPDCQYLRLAPVLQDIMLIVRMHVSTTPTTDYERTLEETLEFWLPYSMMEPVLPNLTLNRLYARENESKAVVDIQAQQVPVRCGVELGRTKMRLAEVMRLQPGNIIDVRTRVDAALPITINGMVKRWGYCGNHHGQKAFKIGGGPLAGADSQ